MSDIYETLDFGYDPSIPEDIPLVAPPVPATPLPTKANVNPKWLPPVGKQTTPSCFVWASVYGLATFWAAKTHNLDPADAGNQASPIYTYIRVELQQGRSDNTCQGGKINWCLEFLKSNGGTASMVQAPDEQGCPAAWTSWGSATLPPNALFQPTSWLGVPLQGTDGMNNLRTLVSQGTPIAFGASLYTDFAPYAGSPVPYVGNGVWGKNKRTCEKVGHVMVIIGYDDTCGPNGAVLVQNSFGSSWGSQWNGHGGYVWIDNDTFQAMIQGGGVHITG